MAQKLRWRIPTFSILISIGIGAMAMPSVRKTVQRAVGSQVCISPDRALVAKVVSVKSRFSYGGPPSRIDILDRKGHLLASRDHSYYPNQGLTAGKASWTKDSRFFVYMTEQSGGHSPWIHPVFFYSRNLKWFYSLDDAIEAVGAGGDGAITGDLMLRSPCTVITSGRYFGKEHAGLHTKVDPKDTSGGRILTIDLGWLEAHLTKAAISTDRKYKDAKANLDRQSGQ